VTALGATPSLPIISPEVGFPSVDAPFQAREKVRIVVSAWSDAVICPAFDAAE
jgi:hypothetical protein